MITQTELKEQLDYNPETGTFTWKVSKSGRKLGGIIGTKNNLGYLITRFNYKIYSLHRLAWLYIYGEMPDDMVDHINGIKDDNRIENLRVVTNRENQTNTYKNRKGRLVGAHFHKRAGKWCCSVKVDGKSTHLGYFETQELAHEAYLKHLTTLDK